MIHRVLRSVVPPAVLLAMLLVLAHSPRGGVAIASYLLMYPVAILSSAYAVFVLPARAKRRE